MIVLRINQTHYHFGLHILPPGLNEIGWTVQLVEYALVLGQK